MSKQVLFAVDGGPASRAAVPVVAAYARDSGAAVRVLHIVHDDSLNGAGARRLVTSFVEAFSKAGVTAGGQVHLLRQGNIADAIAQAAVAGEADLVAIATHGRCDLGALFLGSVSRRVAQDLDLPVLVVRTGPEATNALRRVLVCVDGTRASEDAIACAAEFAAGSGADLRVLFVREFLAFEGAMFYATEEESNAIAWRAAAQLSRLGLRAEVETVLGYQAAATIVAVAERWGADLVVLASRRPSGLSGLLLGSVAHQVIHGLHRPVLLAGRKSGAAPAAVCWGAHDPEPVAGVR